MGSGLRLDDLVDSALHPPQYEYAVTGQRRRKPRTAVAGDQQQQPVGPIGRTVELNKRKVTLFRHNKLVFAVDAACPHNGAALEAGDIEAYSGDSGDWGCAPSLCVVCPRHSFVFNLSSGRSELPPGTFQLGTYPTRVEAGAGGDGEIFVSMPALDSRLFGKDLDF
jgi:nitrite reductase/ring-hydroxylating ferredoxin subunit